MDYSFAEELRKGMRVAGAIVMAARDAWNPLAKDRRNAAIAPLARGEGCDRIGEAARRSRTSKRQRRLQRDRSEGGDIGDGGGAGASDDGGDGGAVGAHS